MGEKQEREILCVYFLLTLGKVRRCIGPTHNLGQSRQIPKARCEQTSGWGFPSAKRENHGGRERPLKEATYWDRESKRTKQYRGEAERAVN